MCCRLHGSHAHVPMAHFTWNAGRACRRPRPRWPWRRRRRNPPLLDPPAAPPPHACWMRPPSRRLCWRRQAGPRWSWPVGRQGRRTRGSRASRWASLTTTPAAGAAAGAAACCARAEPAARPAPATAWHGSTTPGQLPACGRLSRGVYMPASDAVGGRGKGAAASSGGTPRADGVGQQRQYHYGSSRREQAGASGSRQMMMRSFKSAMRIVLGGRGSSVFVSACVARLRVCFEDGARQCGGATCRKKGGRTRGKPSQRGQGQRRCAVRARCSAEEVGGLQPVSRAGQRR